LADCESELDSVVEKLSAIAKHRRLSESLADIKVPDEPERSQYTTAEADKHIELCSSILEAISSKSTLIESNPKFEALRSEAKVATAIAFSTAKVNDSEKAIIQIRTVQGEVAAAITQCEQFKNTNKVYRSEFEQTEAEIAKLTPSMQNKKLLEILVKVYGPKGLRAHAAQSVCKLFETNLNHYRDLIFIEPFSFSVTASDTGVSILVDRNNGDSDSISDVRNLSGAESNCFQLLSLISLLPLIPKKDRVNLVVLDEPTSHQDPKSRALFNERFLPVLREIVPCVYVITPHADDVSPDSGEWVVQKKDGVSTVKVLQ
jgi:DNA repair exonuclease SbcCD ATPase subunit